jgi:hypothetical protein
MQLDVTYDSRLVRELDAPPKVSRAESLRAAVSLNGGNAWLMNFIHVARGPGKLSFDEYLYYRLFDPALTREEIRRFVGKRVQGKLHAACNDPRWFAVSHDKALFYTTLAGAGLPVPETVAVYAPKGRSGFPVTLRSAEDIRRYLAGYSDWPLFAKPITGIYSVGAIHITGRQGDELVMKNGERAAVEQVADYMAAFSEDGYLFQRILVADETLAAVLGPTMPSLRCLVLWSGDTPLIESAILKIVGGGNVADNYWRRGNMLGSVDLETGAIRRVVSGTAHELTELDAHPDTGKGLVGVRLPNWSDVLDRVSYAAALFPGIRTQSWDVSLSSAGPVFLEFNFGGDLNLHQLAHGRGALSDGYKAHLRACGYKGRLD